MNLDVTHITEYHYSEPAWDSFNELWLRPADDYRQTLLAFELSISPKAPVRSRKDYYDNLIHHFHLPNNHTELRIAAHSKVMTYPTPAPLAVSARTLPELRHRFFEYLAPTKRVPMNHNWPQAFGALPLNEDDNLVTYLSNLKPLPQPPLHLQTQRYPRRHAARDLCPEQRRCLSGFRPRHARAVPHS